MLKFIRIKTDNTDRSFCYKHGQECFQKCRQNKGGEHAFVQCYEVIKSDDFFVDGIDTCLKFGQLKWQRAEGE